MEGRTPSRNGKLIVHPFFFFLKRGRPHDCLRVHPQERGPLYQLPGQGPGLSPGVCTSIGTATPRLAFVIGRTRVEPSSIAHCH